jgi:sugar phosphate isomerase/epimerase
VSVPGTAINLYSVRDIDESLPATMRRVAEAGYDGVQFDGLEETAESEVRETLAETGLDTTAAHVHLESLRANPVEVATTYGSLGCDGVVVFSMDVSRFETADDVAGLASELAELAATLDDHGLMLHYHNHSHEFADIDGDPAMAHLLEAAPNVGFELDVGWAAVGGADPVEAVRRFDDRISVLHAKSVELDPWGFSEIGEGDIAMADCLDAAIEGDIKWLVYEHDDPADPVASLERGATYLADYR